MAGSKRPAPGACPSAQKKPKHARGKGKEAGEPTETASIASVIVEDRVDQDLEGAFLGTILLDVRILDTRWDKNRRNRDIQPGLVARLKEAFKNGIKRYAIEDHLKATTTEPEFDGLLKANLPNSTGSPDSDLSYLRNRAATHSGLKAMMLHIENLPYKTQLTLRNGQHRVRALIELCNEQRELAASGASDDSGRPIRPPGNEDYLWAVDLYDNNKLTLWETVSNESLWQDANLQSLLKEPEPTIGSDGEERQRYLSRFQYIHWIEIVKLVTEARPNCLQGFMSDFNDHDRLTAVYEPYTPWGEIFCKTNFSKNRMLQKTPCLNTKAIRDDIVLQGEIFGALVHYRHLKQQMILTSKWGWQKPATENPARPSGLIASPEEYETAVEVLKELAALLVKFGYRPDIDNWNENLASFTMDRSPKSHLLTDIPAKAGFLIARPPAFVDQDDDARAMARTLQQSIVRDRLERALPRRDRKPAEESTM
ncbi:hypothetical protein ATERTT37_002208 [Aspergillus terreus]